MAVEEARILAVVAKQVGMNSATWRALQAAGVTEQTQLKLDFFFDAPGESQANELAEFIRNETDYGVSVESSGGGAFKKKKWRVSGQTKNTPLSEEILNDWVKWMVFSGFQHGDCEFDGWGAMAPY
jgi:Regulator of ribonuclease activity B